MLTREDLVEETRKVDVNSEDKKVGLGVKTHIFEPILPARGGHMY